MAEGAGFELNSDWAQNPSVQQLSEEVGSGVWCFFWYKSWYAEAVLSNTNYIRSIRHSFQDRLTAADMPDRLQADLMGHKFNRPRYGEGPTLEHKLEWLKRVNVSDVEDASAAANWEIRQ
ncbi:hypothetical protein OSH11_13645 [Kaistia dalseonensis]|uniref:Uncharacterized protein n=1 Tax=Kaistia dalseonensis TaxID=410840 RepID=A0ABU0H7R0_9HYPH|nr:hypothetical protein [Kaistia dalseonensis]MCX5495752.1 hypothetical protein [Kaistia dalseonensis]MDQ0438352.1 hypothetical protein [Kaistia dalseonensis]